MTEGLREMTDKDVARVTELANAYLQTFKVAPRLNEDEVKHWMLPIPNVVYSFVVEVSAIQDIFTVRDSPTHYSSQRTQKHTK